MHDLLNALEAQLSQNSPCGCGLCPNHRTDGLNVIAKIRDQIETLEAQVADAPPPADVQLLALANRTLGDQLDDLRKQMDELVTQKETLLETLVMAEKTLSRNGFDNDWVKDRLDDINAVIDAFKRPA